MHKNFFLLVLGTLTLLVISVAVSNPFSRNALLSPDDASDFYQRHPNWKWSISQGNNVIPVTSNAAFPDYYQRHRELRTPAEMAADTTDYFARHPGLLTPKQWFDLTDYYFRHPELRMK